MTFHDVNVTVSQSHPSTNFWVVGVDRYATFCPHFVWRVDVFITHAVLAQVVVVASGTLEERAFDRVHPAAVTLVTFEHPDMSQQGLSKKRTELPLQPLTFVIGTLMFNY